MASLLIGTAAYGQVPAGFVAEGDLSVVPNQNVTPGPGNPATGASYGNSPQVLDTGVNGVGQQISFNQVSATGASLGTCTGTLINPRTVITAAHCVYNSPAHQYGSQTGTGGGVNGNFGAGGALVTSQGTPISFGFGATNRCLGVTVNGCAAGEGGYEAWRDSSFKTQTARHIYNGNQVWYHTGSQPVSLGGGGEFANGDIALVTLDTHAKGIPTWTLLFSPLDGPTHATITGYGTTGVGIAPIGSFAGSDYRRRSAENMIDALMSWHDQNTAPAISGPNSVVRIAHQHSIYWTDFDDPNWSAEAAAANPAFFRNTAKPCAPGTTATPANGYCGRNNGYYDFNGLGGPSGTALPFEGTTGPGDSGGPLIVDQRWDRKVVAGVLTGSISYNGGISTYGSMSVYPPLFQFWEDIVQNNPYVYASAKAGNGDWSDKGHWVQDMDPNYVVIGPDGQLVNAVPDTRQGGGDGPTAKFGTICFLNQNCSDVVGPGNPVGDGTPIVTFGGPGSTNFVPDNVEPVNSANAALHKKARYYDVTLRETGTTTLGQAATIDKLTLNGASKLDIKSSGNLRVLSDFNQIAGWTNVDGLLNTGEAMIATGYLTGSGTFRAPYLTVVSGIVAPGGADKVGTLTVDGNLILASASALYVDARRGAADKLAVTGSAGNGLLTLSNASLVFNKVTDAPAPRHGETYTIATASGGIEGKFGTVYSFQGVLRPELTYGTNQITALLRAGSLVTILDGQNATALAFAGALDQLRSTSYNQLYGLYGAVDLMGTQQLSATLNSLAPRIAGETRSLQDRQSRVMLNAVTDRLSSLGTRSIQGGLSVVGTPTSMVTMQSAHGAAQQGFAGLVPGSSTTGKLPKGLTGFISGGVTSDSAGYGQNRSNVQGQLASHVGMGLEMELAEGLTLGTAFGHSRGYSAPGADRTESKMSQMAVYGSYRLGGGVYVAGVASAETSRANLQRQATTGDAAFDLHGATNSARYNLMAEAGANLNVARGLTLTPRAQLAYGSYRLGGFRENGGEIALQMDELQMENVEARLGAKLAGSSSLGKGWTLVPQLQADYVRMVAGSEGGMKVRFANAGDHIFALPMAGGDTSWAEARGGLKLTNGNLEFGAGLETTVGRAQVRNDRAVADFTFRF